ncbi:MAG: PIG-L deacetylase family protein [Armatimonadota bacterium]
MPISTNKPSNDNNAVRDRLFEAKRVLFISAHPDDIEFYCGGLVRMMRERGIDVTFAIGTRGGKGLKGWLRRRLERLRAAHQLESARILGGAEVIFYDYPDKFLSDHIELYARDLMTLIECIDPDIIFSWDPDFIYNPHPDHQAAADAARIASTGRRVCYYGTREPNLWVGFGEDVLKVKLKALRAHRTETPWYYWMLIRGRLIAKLRGEGAKVGQIYAEVLRLEH